MESRLEYIAPRIRVALVADFPPILQSSLEGGNEDPTPGIGIGDDE